MSADTRLVAISGEPDPFDLLRDRLIDVMADTLSPGIVRLPQYSDAADAACASLCDTLESDGES